MHCCQLMLNWGAPAFGYSIRDFSESQKSVCLFCWGGFCWVFWVVGSGDGGFAEWQCVVF
jgi:hypothetical protein